MTSQGGTEGYADSWHLADDPPQADITEPFQYPQLSRYDVRP